MRALARGIAFALMGGAAAASAAPGEAITPAEPLLDAVGAQSAVPSIAMTPDGRHAVTFVAASPAISGLLAQLSHGPYWMPAWDAPLQLQIDGHASVVSPSVSISRYGYPLIAWERRNASYQSEGVYLRYHNANGNPVGGLARVDQQLPLQTHVIRTASNGYGTRHIVVWGAERGGARDARARWYDNAMLPLGDEVRVDVGGLDVYPAIDVAMLQAMPDAAVIAYIGLPDVNPVFPNTLYLRRMDTYGLLSDPVALAAGEGEAGWNYVADTPSLAATADGGVVAVWRMIAAQSGSTQRRVQIRAQRLDANLVPLAPAFAVTPPLAHTDAYQSPDVAAASAGGFAVVWRERSAVGAPVQIRLQRFDASGLAIDAATTVADGAQDLLMPVVALDADGDAAVGWTAILADGSYQAMRRRYRGDGQVDLALPHTPGVSLAPGESAVLAVPVQNLSPPASTMIDFGRDYASGIALALQLDPALSASVTPGSGWHCSGSTELLCSLNAIVATGSSAPPLELHVRAPSVPGSYSIQAVVGGDQDDPQSGNNNTAITVHVIDQVPDAFTFAAVDGVARSSLVVSMSVELDGFDGALPATVSDGELSVNGGAFTSSSTQVTAGDNVRLRHTAAASFATATVSTLSIGGVSASFTSTTEAADTTPEVFAFASTSNVARSTPVDSAAITVAGINAPAAISVSNGSYSIDGGTFTTSPGQISVGQQVRVRHTSASAFGTSTTSTLTIGGVSAGFTSTTEAADTTPEAFAFASTSNVARNTAIDSAAVTVAGINAPASISVSNGSYSIDGGAFTASPGQVNAGQQVRVRHTSASAFSTGTTSTLSIGGVSAGFTSTTEAADTTPAAFNFVDVVDARKRSTVSSNIVTVSGINAPATVSVSGGGASFAINGGSFSTTSRTAVAGDRVQMRLTASNSSYTTTTATLSIGGVSDVWRVTTGRK